MKRIRSIQRRGGLAAAGLLLLLAAVLLWAGAAWAGSGASYLWLAVIGGGGGHVENDIYALDATIGQAVAGAAANDTHELCAGFWCGTTLVNRHTVYCPIIVRNVTVP